MAYSLRVQWPNGRRTVNELTGATTMADFQAFLAELTGIAATEQRILAGIHRHYGSLHPHLTPCAVCIGIGYPVTTVSFDPARAHHQSLSSLGLHRGETVRIERKPAATLPDMATAKPTPTITPVNPTATSHSHRDTAERPLRRVVPADNSCLFRAIAYLLHPEVVVLGCPAAQVPTPLATSLRTVVANTVLSNPETYSEAMLGKPPADYATWIQKSESWGGM